MILDPALPRLVDVFAGVKPGGLAFLNAEAMPAEMTAAPPPDIDVICMDVTSIALRHKLGTAETPIVNTAVLGGFAGATGIAGCDALERAIRDTVPQHADRNVEAMREAYQSAKEGRFRRVEH